MATQWYEENESGEFESWQIRQLEAFQKSVREYNETIERKATIEKHQMETPTTLAAQKEFIKSSRNDRLFHAKEILRKDTSLPISKINERIREQHGVGLRHSDIAKIRRDIFKESPRLIPDRLITPRYIKAVYGSQESQRLAKLINSNLWTKQEALTFSHLPLSRLSYFGDMASARQNLIAQLKIQQKMEGWSNAVFKIKLHEAILSEYKTRGWQNKAGVNEPYRMVDDFRQVLIDNGKNPYLQKGKMVFRNPDGTFRFLRNKGDTIAQKARYRKLYPDRIREQKARYRQLHPDRIRAQKRAWRHQVKSGLHKG